MPVNDDAKAAATMYYTRYLAVRRQVAYGAVMLASSALNNVFVTYYIGLFASMSALRPAWFYAGQLIFMLWNAVNDPLFGWLSDTMHLPQWWTGVSPSSSKNTSASSAPSSPLARRAGAIRWGGLAWCMAFTLVWWPWAGADVSSSSSGSDVDGSAISSSWSPPSVLAGLHFTLSLLLYDSALTYVEVNHSALLAEMSHSSGQRAGANAWAAGMAAAGSATSLIAYATWDRSDLRAFRTFTGALALGCAFIFAWAAGVLQEVEEADDGTAAANASLLADGLERAPLIDSSNTSSAENGDMVAAASDESSFSNDLTAQSAAGPRHRANLLMSPLSAEHVGDNGAAATSIDDDDEEDSVHGGSDHNNASPAPGTSYRALVTQLASSPNFRVFTIVSILQTFDCTFEKNFFVPFMDLLALSATSYSSSNESVSGGDDFGGSGDSNSSSSDSDRSGLFSSLHVRGAVISLSFLLPHLCTIGWTPLIQSRGLATTLRLIFRSRLLLLLAVWAVVRYTSSSSTTAAGVGTPSSLRLPVAIPGASDGVSDGALKSIDDSSNSVLPGLSGLGGHGGLLAFMLANRVLSESVCRLFPLALSDLVDEDAARHRRPPSLSASIMGSASFLPKFAQSLAPIAVYALLPELRGRTASTGASAVLPTAATGTTSEAISGATSTFTQRAIAAFGGSGAFAAGRASISIQSIAWGLLLLVPLITVLIQLAAWGRYSLHGAYLKGVLAGAKHAAAAAEGASGGEGEVHPYPPSLEVGVSVQSSSGKERSGRRGKQLSGHHQSA